MPPPTPLAIGTPSIFGVDSPPSNSDGQPDSPEISLTVPQLPPQVGATNTVMLLVISSSSLESESLLKHELM